MRKLKGRLIAHTKHIDNLGNGIFMVPSENNNGLKYNVILNHDLQLCTCPDFVKRTIACKHIYAVMDLADHGGKIPQ